MKHLIVASAVIGGLCSQAAHAAVPAECFAKPAAVFAAHPNATHASYTLRLKRSQRCWFADAFKADESPVKVEADPQPQPREGVVDSIFAFLFKAEANPEPQPGDTAVEPPPQPSAKVGPPAPQPRKGALVSAPKLRTATAAHALQPRTTGAAPAQQPRTTGAPPAQQPRAVAIKPAPPSTVFDFPMQIIAQGLNRLAPVDESPTDFEGRFSVTGYKMLK
jgi:hypothetical protein